jgi:hypothetical protein
VHATAMRGVRGRERVWLRLLVGLEKSELSVEGKRGKANPRADVFEVRE